MRHSSRWHSEDRFAIHRQGDGGDEEAQNRAVRGALSVHIHHKFKTCKVKLFDEWIESKTSLLILRMSFSCSSNWASQIEFQGCINCHGLWRVECCVFINIVLVSGDCDMICFNRSCHHPFEYCTEKSKTPPPNVGPELLTINSAGLRGGDLHFWLNSFSHHRTETYRLRRLQQVQCGAQSHDPEIKSLRLYWLETRRSFAQEGANPWVCRLRLPCHPTNNRKCLGFWFHHVSNKSKGNWSDEWMG